MFPKWQSKGPSWWLSRLISAKKWSILTIRRPVNSGGTSSNDAEFSMDKGVDKIVGVLFTGVWGGGDGGGGVRGVGAGRGEARCVDVAAARSRQ